jgi:hypothetical protein
MFTSPATAAVCLLYSRHLYYITEMSNYSTHFNKLCNCLLQFWCQHTVLLNMGLLTILSICSAGGEDDHETWPGNLNGRVAYTQ